MVADANAHQKLILALERLAQGDSPAFEDTLWLAFGDHWTSVVRRLLQRRLIAYHALEDFYSITDAGVDALGQLRREAEGPPSASDSPISA